MLSATTLKSVYVKPLLKFTATPERANNLGDQAREAQKKGQIDKAIILYRQSAEEFIKVGDLASLDAAEAQGTLAKNLEDRKSQRPEQ